MTYTNEEKMRIINQLDKGDSIKGLCSAYVSPAVLSTDGHMTAANLSLT